MQRLCLPGCQLKKKMNYLRLPALIVAVCLTVMACKKDNKTEDNLPVDDSIQGTWELRQSYSGMTPLTDYQSGNGNTVRFDETHFYFYANGQVVRQGTYHVTTDSIVDVNSCELKAASSAKPNRIYFSDNPSSFRFSFEIANNRFTTMSGCVPLDGGWQVYKRISSPE